MFAHFGMKVLLIEAHVLCKYSFFVLACCNVSISVSS
jgi:hypothetical protein